MKWPSSRSVAALWLLAALSLVGWLVKNLDTAGWIILVLTVGLMAFERTPERDALGGTPTRRAPDEPAGSRRAPFQATHRPEETHVDTGGASQRSDQMGRR
jgi:hypothetical protein